MTEIRKRHDGLSIAEAAAELGVHPNTIRNWIASGDLPATKVGPRPTSPRRIKPEDLDRFRGAPDHPPRAA
jgi:excisionase family DNA binding protein